MHNTGSSEDSEQQNSSIECGVGENVESADEKEWKDVLHVIQMCSERYEGIKGDYLFVFKS